MAGVWYYTRNGQQMGPVGDLDLQRMAATGELRPTELIWTEGMPNWSSAGSVQGLFPPAGAARTPSPSPSAAASGETYQAAPPQGRRSSYEPEEEDDFEPQPRQRRKKKGMSAGMLILLIGGVGFLLLLCVVGGIIAIVLLGADTGPPEGTRHWSLKNNEKTFFNIYFKAGQRVDITVKSTGKSDVDLFVFDGDRQIVADEGPSSDCFVTFVPSASKTYRVEVWNRLIIGGPPGINQPNSGTLHYKQFGPSNPAVQPGKNNAPPEKVPPPPLFQPGGMDLDTNGNLPLAGQLTYNIHMNANTRYTIDLNSQVFDSYLELLDPNGIMVAADDDSGGNLNARIVYVPLQTGNFRIIVRSFQNQGGGAFRLTVGH